MKRPLVLVGCCTLLTLAAAVFLGEKISFFLFWVCLAGFCATLFFRRTRRAAVFPLAFLTAAFSLACFCRYMQSSILPARVLDGRDAEVEAEICELPYRQYGRWYYVVEAGNISVPGAPRNIRLRLSSQKGLKVKPYSRIRCRVHLFLPQGGDGYSSRTYYESRGILLFGYIPAYGSVQILPPDRNPPYAYALRLREAMLRSVDTMLPPKEAALVKGVLLGDKTSLSAETAADFRTDGISHILSVSGLHMSTIAGLLILLLAFLHVPQRPAASVTAAGVLCFMAVTGFVPSVSRSGLMCLLTLAAPLISRRADPLNSLCAAVWVLCLKNPLAAADVGLLLSFSATMGLILLAGPIQRFLNKKLDRFRPVRLLVRGMDGVLATSVAATLFTLPVILLSFGTVSVISPLSNLLELVPSTLMISFSAVAAALNLLLPQTFLAMPFALCSGLLAKYMLACARWLAGIPLASVSASAGFVKLWLAGTLLLLAAALLLARSNRLLPHAACLSIILLTVGILSFQTSAMDTVRIAALDVGAGEAVAVTCDGHAAVIGCGGYNSGTVLRYLNGQNVRSLDYAQTLTGSVEENSNLADIASHCRPVHLLAAESDRADGFVQEAGEKSQKTTVYRDSARADLWGRVQIETTICGKAAAAKITAGGLAVLVLPAKADVSALPPSWRCPDAAVLEKCEAGISPGFDIFSIDRDARKQVLSGEKGACCWTGGSGTVVLEIGKNKKLSVRRES